MKLKPTVKSSEKKPSTLNSLLLNLLLKISLMPMTLGLLVIMFVVFLIQIVNGVDVTSPTVDDMVRWGANRLQLTVKQDAWRLLTSVFIHIGWLHLLLNAFVLCMLGRMAELLFGSWRYVWIFLMSAIAGSLLTNITEWIELWQQAKIIAHMSNDMVIYNTPITSAGASAGIMGVGGSLLTYTGLMHYWLNNNTLRGEAYDFYHDFDRDFNLIKSKLDKTLEFGMSPQFLSIILFGSIMYGYFDDTVDNAGHVGGLIVGLFLGVVLARKYRYQQSNVYFYLGLIVLASLMFISWLFLHSNPLS